MAGEPINVTNKNLLAVTSSGHVTNRVKPPCFVPRPEEAFRAARDSLQSLRELEGGVSKQICGTGSTMF